MKTKTLFALLLVAVLTCCNFLNALADGVSIPPASQISSNPIFSSDSKNFSINKIPDDPRLTGEDGLQLLVIRSSISKAGSSSITFSATTTANIVCINIGGTIRVQRWINNEWTTYYSYLFRGHGVSTHSTSRTISVEPGYYYRVTTSHTAITEYSAKHGTTTVKSIFVN